MKSIFALLAILIMAMAPMVLADDGTDHASEDGESEVQDNEVQKRGKGMGRANADTRLESRTARKQKMKAMREGLQSCAGQRTEECKTLRRQARTDAKEVLQHTVGRINDLLEIAKERIAASNMPEDQKAQLLAELNAKLADVVSTEEVSGELSPTSTTAQVKKAAKEVRKQAQESRRALRKAAHHLISGKLGGALKRAEQLEAKLERIVERMKASGVDVSILSDAFASKIVDARTAYDQSTQLFEQARAAEAGQKDELMKQATSELRESHKILKEAHVLLRDQPLLSKQLKAREKELTMRETGMEIGVRRLLDREEEVQALEQRREKAFESYLREEVERVKEGKPAKQIVHPEIHSMIDETREKVMQGNLDDAVRMVVEVEYLIEKLKSADQRRLFMYDIRDLKASIKLASLT